MPVALRVLALSLYPESAPSTRFRLAQFIPPLRAAGIDMTIRPFLTNEEYAIARRSGPIRAAQQLMKGFRRLMATVASSGDFDVVIVQRNLAPVLDRSFLAALQRKGVPIVFDFDDAVFLRLEGGRPWLETLRAPQVTATEFCRAASVILAGNEYLAGFARKAVGAANAQRVRIFPSVIDTDRFVPASESAGRLPTLGWVGSDTTVPYLERLAPELARLRDVCEYRLVVVAGKARPEMGNLEYEFIPWSEKTEVEVFHQLDVGLYPLDDTPWSRGKCGFKAVQYLSCGVPCVASPVGPLVSIVRHGESGFHARTDDDWLGYCRRLLEDSALRERMGRVGRESVIDSFSLASATPLLVAALRSAAGVGS